MADTDDTAHLPDNTAMLRRTRRAILATIRRERQKQTTTRDALTVTGRGVPTDPACRPQPVAEIQWSDAARKNLPKRGTK